MQFRQCTNISNISIFLIYFLDRSRESLLALCRLLREHSAGNSISVNVLLNYYFLLFSIIQYHSKLVYWSATFCIWARNVCCDVYVCGVGYRFCLILWFFYWILPDRVVLFVFNLVKSFLSFGNLSFHQLIKNPSVNRFK